MNFDLRFYWKLFLRRFPVMALLFILCTGLATYTAIRLPDTFQSSARLLVDEPQIPDRMVATTVQTGAVEELDIIQQRLMTRANLIDIANKFNVYNDLREVSPDEIVERMTQNTDILRVAGRDRATMMTIAFEAESGRTAADVVNEYVTLVLDANTEFRMSRADGTLDFFNDEVERLGRELDQQSTQISVFKSEHADALPENQAYRLGRQSLLQERMSQLERDLRTTELQRADMQRIFETTGRIGQQENTGPASPAEAQLLVVKTDLALVLETYSADNPRAIRLQSEVDRLEAIIASQTALQQPESDAEELSAEEMMFRATMAEMENRIETTEQEIERTKMELDELQALIVESSSNGVLLAALERDYEMIQSRYNAAVANLNDAQVSERIETTGQGRRITVIEAANVPVDPSGPSRPKIAVMGAAAGMALAAGFFALLEFMNRTIRRPEELVGKYGITPIATIPYMESRGRRILRRLTLVLFSLLVLVGTPSALWYIDTHYMPLDLLVQKVLDRLNLG